MESEIKESLTKLRRIGHELGVNEDPDPHPVEENAFDYTERILFSMVQDIKLVISNRSFVGSWSSEGIKNPSCARTERLLSS